MDHALVAAARALALGDPLGALKWVALRDDAPALSLRGIALAQLGELKRAQLLLRRAARAFENDTLARARCVLAEREVALAMREFRWPEPALDHALRAFAAAGEHTNLAHGELLRIRILVLLGRVEEAEHALGAFALARAPAMLRVRAELIAGELELRRGRAKGARQAFARAWTAAQGTRIPALVAEVEHAQAALARPAGRLIVQGEERMLKLEDIERLLSTRRLVVDARRRRLQRGAVVVDLKRRPVLLAILRCLTESFPEDVPRDVLVARAFGARRVSASLRARLRVEVSRLRALVRELCGVRATPQGFLLVTKAPSSPCVLAPLEESSGGGLLALLSDGESWSTSGLALGLGMSQRSVQRTLGALQTEGRVCGTGRGRTRRWCIAFTPEIATTMLLPAPPGAG